jgi:hypothetical protein
MTAKPNAETNTDVFTFTVVLHGVEENTKQLENKLFEAGCDDASLASRDGRIALEFGREAESLSSAVGSAIDDIQAAGYQIAAIRIREQATGDLAAELSAWEAASDEDFESFENRLE